MFKALILIFAVSLAFGVGFNPKQSMNECLYEIHQAQNELLAVLALGYIHEGEESFALLVMSDIYEYPHERGVYSDFMQKTARKIAKIKDKDKAKVYVLELLKSKEQNLRYFKKKCDRLARLKGLK
jgi:hypothetical protein|nr:MAG TPA_asm: hypothetical protein [Caudoviricetes sp.]